MSTSFKVQGPDFVALQWRDLAAARRFYEETVGLEPAPQSPPGAVVFATEPISFAVRTPLVDLDLSPYLGHGVGLWLRVDDSRALHDHLVDERVEVVSGMTDGFFGRTFTFRDPEGYLITIHDGG